MLNIITTTLVLVFLLILLFKHKQKSSHKSFIAALILLGTYIALSFTNMAFLSTIVTIIIALLMALIFQLKMKTKINYWVLGIAVVVGFIFGKLFFIMNEPRIMVMQFILFALLVAVAEELMFRFIMLRTMETEFGFKFALIMQAIFFVLLHILDLDLLVTHYKSYLQLGAYIVLLFAFALSAGALMKGKRGSILYPMIMHFIANLVLFSL